MIAVIDCRKKRLKGGVKTRSRRDVERKDFYWKKERMRKRIWFFWSRWVVVRILKESD